MLDLATRDPKWHRVHVRGDGPGKRYAHVLSFVAQRFLVVFGGTDGSKCLGDMWVLDTSTTVRVDEMFADGADSVREDVCEREHASDGCCCCAGERRGWVRAERRIGREAPRRTVGMGEAPGKAPTRRYQHATAFVDTRLHITGGASGGGQLVPGDATMSMLDTSAGGSTGWRAAKGSRGRRSCPTTPPRSSVDGAATRARHTGPSSSCTVDCATGRC